MGSSNIDEAKNFYENSSTEVKELAIKFFKSMDTDNNGSVNFQEIQKLFQSGDFLIDPCRERTLFDELDRNHDNSLDFHEFITFFYIVFLKARCALCDKCLIGQKRRTCVRCFMTTDISTYDVCRSCFHMHMHGNKHEHPKSDFKKFEELVFIKKVTTNDAMQAAALNNLYHLYIGILLGMGIGLSCSIM